MNVLLVTVTAVGMLAGVNWLVWKNRRPTFAAVVVCFVCSGAPALCVLFLLPLLLQGLVLAALLPLVYIPRRGPAIYHAASALVALIIWVSVGVRVYQKEQQYADWRVENQFESMTDRVSEPTRSENDGGTHGSAWAHVEEELKRGEYEMRSRKWSLRAIHDHRTALFHKAMGFGAARMIFPFEPNPDHFAPEFVPSIPQADEYVPDLVSLGDEAPAERVAGFGKMHAGVVLDFVNPNGWGYVKSRTQVAGFRPHRFGGSPEMIDRWAVSRVDLIGLLKHDKPAVYVSDLLPRMDQLKDAPTREVDSFEAEGLRAARKGDDLFARGTDQDARMVGAIRSVTQCTECHGGQRGDLLGAFSYRLTKLKEAK